MAKRTSLDKLLKITPTEDVKLAHSPVHTRVAVAGAETAGVVGFRVERVSHVSCQVLIASSIVESRVVPPEHSLFSVLQP